MGMQQKNKDSYMYHDNVDQQGQDKRPEGMQIAPRVGSRPELLQRSMRDAFDVARSMPWTCQPWQESQFDVAVA